MNPLPPISVCMPVYNGEAYLGQALDSVLAQSLQDFELLIVDDCSQDGSTEIIQEYAARDTRIRVYRNTHNHGLVGNWNRCIALARGEWIKFLFHDDLMRPDCLSRFMAAADDTDQILFCRRALLLEDDLGDNWRKFYEDHAQLLAATFAQGEHMSATAVGHWALRHLLSNFLGEPTSMMFRRQAAFEHGPFNDALIMLCDIEFALRIASNTGIRLIDEALVSFRAHGGSSSAAAFNTRQFRNKYIDTIIWLHDMSFARPYARLRETAASCQPAVNLHRELHGRVQLAEEYIAKAKAQSAEAAATMKSSLRTTQEQYPGAQLSTANQLAWKLRKAYWAVAAR